MCVCVCVCIQLGPGTLTALPLEPDTFLAVEKAPAMDLHKEQKTR